MNVEQAAGGDSSLGLQPLPLKEGLLRKDLDKWDQNQLKEDFEKKTLRGLAKTVEEKEYPGSDFIANVRGLAQDFPNGVESLAAIVNSQLSEQQNRADPDIDFCGNGALLDDGKFYYLERDHTTPLLSTLRENPAFYLIHGPCGSGKSTLARQMIIDLDDSCYVFGKVEFLENIPVSDMWTTMAKSLGEVNSNASKEVREDPKKYLVLSTQAGPNFLHHLFRQDYDGKKLVLFFDEFDHAYDMKYREEVAFTFREMSETKQLFRMYQGQLGGGREHPPANWRPRGSRQCLWPLHQTRTWRELRLDQVERFQYQVEVDSVHINTVCVCGSDGLP